MLTTLFIILSVLGGVVFTVFRLVRTYKTNIELKNTVNTQSNQLRYQDEVIKDLTKRHSIDDTIAELRSGKF